MACGFDKPLWRRSPHPLHPERRERGGRSALLCSVLARAGFVRVVSPERVLQCVGRVVVADAEVEGERLPSWLITPTGPRTGRPRACLPVGSSGRPNR
jgi:hypothetical protein